MPSRELLTRAATVDDAKGIADVHVRGWQVGYRGIVPDEFLRGLSEPDALQHRTTTWAERLRDGADASVAVLDGRVVSFCTCGPSRDDGAAEGTGEVYALYADPGAWGTGAGFAAHGRVLQRLAKRGSTTATLWVLERNARARRFYERQGWELDTGRGSRKTQEIGGVELVEVRYRREVGTTG